MIEDPIYEEFWQRDVEESIRQGNAKPFIEEAVLQVSNWGFSLADIKLEKKKPGKGFLNWLKFVLTGSEDEYTGFLGPIHIWQVSDIIVLFSIFSCFKLQASLFWYLKSLLVKFLSVMTHEDLTTVHFYDFIRFLSSAMHVLTYSFFILMFQQGISCKDELSENNFGALFASSYGSC